MRNRLLLCASAMLVASTALGADFPYDAAEVDRQIEDLASKNQNVRERAAANLTCLGEEALPILIKLLDHKEQAMRSRALSVIGRIGPDAKSAIPALRQITLQRYEMLNGATDALVKIGPDSVPALLAALRDPSTQVRQRAIWALGQLGPDARAAVPDLRRAMGDRNKRIAADAIAALGKIGPAARSAVPDLADSVNKAGMAIPVIEALGGIGPDARPAVGVLAKFLGTGGRENARIAAASALARVIPGNPGALTELVKYLGHPKIAYRRSAAQALGNVGPPAAPAVRFLAPLVADKDRALSNNTVAALGKIGPAAKDAAKELVPLLGDKDQNRSNAGADALVGIGPAAIPVLLECLAGNDDRTRRGAARVLERMGPAAKPALKELVSLLDDRDRWVSLSAARALAQMGADAEAAVPVLARHLKAVKKNQWPHWESVYAFRRIGKRTDGVVGVLTESLKSCRHWRTREECAGALAVFGADAADAGPALQGALADEYFSVRRAAQAAAEKVSVARITSF